MRLSPSEMLRIGHAALTRRVPVYAHWGITHRCTLRCRMCGIWRHGDAAEELDLGQIEVMARRMRRLAVPHLTIGGGEPFIRDDLDQVVGALSDQGLTVRVLTNGVTTDPDLLERVVHAGGIHFSVSLDSLSPARYDAICGQPEAWTRGVRTMLRIAELTLPRGGMPILNCVVSSWNLDELPAMVRFAATLGFRISLLPVELLDDPQDHGEQARFIRHCPDMEVQHRGQDIRDKVEATYAELIEMKRMGWPLLNTTPYLRASRDFLAHGRLPPWTCDAGRLYFSIAPDGRYAICHRGARHHGSVLDDDFERYWRGRDHEQARRDEAERCPGCMRACWIDTSFIFRTPRGFLETARTNLRPRPRQLPTYEELLGWARFEGEPAAPCSSG